MQVILSPVEKQRSSDVTISMDLHLSYCLLHGDMALPFPMNGVCSLERSPFPLKQLCYLTQQAGAVLAAWSEACDAASLHSVLRDGGGHSIALQYSVQIWR